LNELTQYLESFFPGIDLSFDLRVGVVDNGQEHVDEHEEDEEHKQYEEDRAQHPVGCLQLVKIEVTEDDSEQRETEEIGQAK
jgi:hypothetical protein